MSENIIIHNIDFDKIPIRQSNWSLYRLDQPGDKTCTHDWLTLTAYTKEYVNMLRPGEVTNDIYNPENEQIQHRVCQICHRVEVLSEHIVMEHYDNVDNWKSAKMQKALTQSISVVYPPIDNI